MWQYTFNLSISIHIPQSVLTEFVQIEMMFHARALKMLSNCYEAAQRIDGEADMEVGRPWLDQATHLWWKDDWEGI